MTSATDDLSIRGVPYRLFRHTTRPTSLEQAALERGQLPDQVIRSILFRLSDQDFVMVLAPGPAQISWPKLRVYLGVKRISLAKPEEVLTVTGYAIGTVSPFGILHPLRLLADKSLAFLSEVSIGSGEHGVAIVMNRADLMTALPHMEYFDLLANPE
jgi:prolyl-tRNA editing enzyme YbaK/EbsC (Cys-tRNA(Pro) deacylase)